MKKVTLIGDSIRLGYQSTVQTLLAGKAEIFAPEENGGTSANILAHLEDWVLKRPPDILHINCGLHDLRKAFGNSVSAVPPDQYAANVRTILERVTTGTGAHVVWALTTPVNEVWHHSKKTFDRFEADVIAYNRIAAGIAGETGITLNDLFAVIEAAGRDTLLWPDGVHFKPEGYRLLGQRVADCILELIAAAK